jgi:DNA (cytosine-5)-methyltransferase 1
MKHLDLFSGIGGFALAARWMNWETVGFCEKDKYAQQILKQHWPCVQIWNDIKEITEPIDCDIITGGFPCQPFSTAGLQTGKADDRYLWPEMLRIITHQRPTWVVAENVTGIIGLALDTVLADLEREGYASRAIIVPAAAVDAPHKRDRVWIISRSISNSQSIRPQRVISTGRIEKGSIERAETEPARVCRSEPVAHSNSKRGCGGNSIGENAAHVGKPPTSEGNHSRGVESWPAEPELGRVANGVSNRVDRIKGLGNAIVPQVAYKLFQAIEKFPD